MFHLASFFLLIHRLYEKRSAVGISLKTQVSRPAAWQGGMAMRMYLSYLLCSSQELYLIVFLARYLDLFTAFHSFYNTGMKLIFIGG